MQRLVRLWACFLLALAAAAAAAQAPVSWPTRGWEAATPESQGMDSRALQSLVEFGTHNQMDSLVVARNGHIVLEAYYAPFHRGSLHAINSATKGVVAGLVGIAIEQGVLGGAQVPLVELFPQFELADRDPRKRAVTLQHLLDMTSGLDWKEPLNDSLPETMLQMTRAPNWARFVAERPMAQAPGVAFNYNSGNSHLASAILTTAAGMDTEAFAARHLFQPLGITEWRWRKDPAGIPIGGFGLYLHTRDMAKIGMLYQHRGQWDGKQVIPAAWVDKVFQPSVPMELAPGLAYRYADSWWTIPARKATMAVGFHRQLIVVLPQQGVVAAMTGRRHYSFELMLDHLQGAVKSAVPLPADPAAVEALAARVRAAAVEVPGAAGAAAPAGERLSGRTWKAGRNELGIRELTVRLGAEAEVEILGQAARGGSAQPTVYRLGTDGLGIATVTPRGPTLGQARWLDDGSLLLQFRFLEEGETGSYRLRPDGERLAVEYEYSAGFRTRFTAEAAQ